MSPNSVTLSEITSVMPTRRTFLTGMIAAFAMPFAIADARAGNSNAPHSTAPANASASQRIARAHHTTTGSALGTVVAGGHYFGALSSVEIFDGSKWREASPLRTPRYHHTAVPYGAGVLVVGGLSASDQPLASAELFDGNVWSEVQPMRFPRSMHAAIPWNGGVLAIGGRYLSALASVEWFDGTSWREIAPLSIPRFGHTIGEVGGAIVIAGGSHLAPLSVQDSFNGVSWTPIYPRPNSTNDPIR